MGAWEGSLFWAFTKAGPDRIGSDRIDKTRTGSEKNRIAINFPPKWSRGTSIEDGGERSM